MRCPFKQPERPNIKCHKIHNNTVSQHGLGLFFCATLLQTLPSRQTTTQKHAIAPKLQAKPSKPPAPNAAQVGGRFPNTDSSEAMQIANHFTIEKRTFVLLFKTFGE